MDTAISQLLDGSRTLQVHDLSAIQWIQPPNVGDTHPTNKLPHGTQKWTLEKDFNTLMINPVKRQPGQDWDTFYNYAPVSIDGQPDHYAYGFGLQFPTAQDIARCPSFEWELAYREEGWLYKLAGCIMLNPASGGPSYCYYDKVKEKWLPLRGVPRPSPKPGVWIDMLWKWSILRSNDDDLRYEEFELNDEGHELNQVVQPVHDGGPDIFNASIQANSYGNGDPYSVNIRNMMTRAI
jgi:hypothetical protein